MHWCAGESELLNLLVISAQVTQFLLHSNKSCCDPLELLQQLSMMVEVDRCFAVLQSKRFNLKHQFGQLQTQLIVTLLTVTDFGQNEALRVGLQVLNLRFRQISSSDEVGQMCFLGLGSL